MADTSSSSQVKPRRTSHYSDIAAGVAAVVVFLGGAYATRNALEFIDDQKAQLNDAQARTLLLEDDLQKLGDPCKPASSMGVVKERSDRSLFIQVGDATIPLPDDAPFKSNEIARIIVTRSGVFIEKPSQCAAQVATTTRQRQHSLKT